MSVKDRLRQSASLSRTAGTAGRISDPVTDLARFGLALVGFAVAIVPAGVPRWIARLSAGLAAFLFAACAILAEDGAERWHSAACDAKFPTLAMQPWRNPAHARFVTADRRPNHRMRDLVLASGEAATLRAHLAYGADDKDLEGEDVEFWFQRCPEWERWGTARADNGVATIAIPSNLPPGEYRVRVLVLGDRTTADGLIAVWPRDTKAIVADVDGTLTTSDWEVPIQILTDRNAQMYPDANAVLRDWANKNYKVVYLSARAGVLMRYTRNWLAGHAFPPGPVHMAQEKENLLGERARRFKAAWLADRGATAGIRWMAGYGNAITDIDAYQDAKIPKADTYIIGPNAGVKDTVRVVSYKDHLAALGRYPPVTQR